MFSSMFDFGNLGENLNEKNSPLGKKPTKIHAGHLVGAGGKKITKTSEPTEYCSDTGKQEPKSRIIKIGNKKFFLRHGLGSLGFIVFERKGFTIANVYKMKDKKYVTTFRFNRKIGWKSAKDYIFDNAQHVAEAMREHERPFRVIFRSTIIPLDTFKENFKPNQFSQKSFATSGKDTALVSLGEILKDVEPVEITSGAHSASINNANRRISHRKRTYDGQLPAVEIYAIWSNFNPESRLLAHAKYDRGEPLLYSYNVIHEKEEINDSA